MMKKKRKSPGHKTFVAAETSGTFLGTQVSVGGRCLCKERDGNQGPKLQQTKQPATPKPNHRGKRHLGPPGEVESLQCPVAHLGQVYQRLPGP